MNWKSLRASACARLLVLALPFGTAACLPTQRTLIEGTESRIAAGVCEVWLPVTYSSRDTEQTQLEVRAGNAARAAYCREH